MTKRDRTICTSDNLCHHISKVKMLYHIMITFDMQNLVMSLFINKILKSTQGLGGFIICMYEEKSEKIKKLKY